MLHPKEFRTITYPAGKATLPHKKYIPLNNNKKRQENRK
jgi:hypothetical protein